MDLKTELLAENSKSQRTRVFQHVLDNPEKSKELIGYFLGNDYRLAQRAAAVVNMLAEHNIEMIRPYLDGMISNLDNEIHDAVKRNTLRMLQFIDIPEEYLGEVTDRCFKYLDSEREAIAIRVFSMTVLYNIVCKIPELKQELVLMIEDHLPYGSAGFQSRANHILGTLKKKD